MSAELLGRVGLDARFGYKIKTRDGEERCFFRFIREGNSPQPSTLNPQPFGSWHDVLARHDFRYQEAQAVEILQHELLRGELIVFGCCCLKCSKDTAKRARAEELGRLGFLVSHGYWPECEPAEFARFDYHPKRQLAAA